MQCGCRMIISCVVQKQALFLVEFHQHATYLHVIQRIIFHPDTTITQFTDHVACRTCSKPPAIVAKCRAVVSRVAVVVVVPSAERFAISDIVASKG